MEAQYYIIQFIQTTHRSGLSRARSDAASGVPRNHVGRCFAVYPAGTPEAGSISGADADGVFGWSATQGKTPSLCFVFGSMDFPSPTSYLRSANLGQPKHGAFEVSLPPALAEAPNSKGMRDGTIAQAPQAFSQNPFPSQFSERSQDRLFSSLVRNACLNRTLHHLEGP